MRIDQRANDQLRPVKIIMDYQKHAGGSCLIACGNTRVICAANVEDGVPPFLEGKEQGWVTAEYGMLPGSTPGRKRRDGVKQDGRSVEIQRLIGRSLRTVVDMKALGVHTVRVDCDVLDADGGTRTAAITGAWCALYALFARMVEQGRLSVIPLKGQLAAVSCGLIEEEPRLDLCYQEDSQAQADVNIVMTSEPAIVEIQGTGEKRAFSRAELQELLYLADKGIQELFVQQRQAVEGNV